MTTWKEDCVFGIFIFVLVLPVAFMGWGCWQVHNDNLYHQAYTKGAADMAQARYEKGCK